MMTCVLVFILLSVIEKLYSFHHDSALKALFLYLAGKLMRIVYIPCIDVIVSVAAAAAIELSPAFFALGL